MKAGVVIDEWKLATFDQRLTEAGYVYTNAGLVEDTILLMVTVDPGKAQALGQLILATTKECDNMRKRGRK